MKKFLSMIAIASMLAFTWACDDEATPTPDAPAITAPSATSVTVGDAVTLTFSTTALGGYKDATVTVTPTAAGTATVTTEPAIGSTTAGNVVVTFTAGANVGIAEVALTVIDNIDQEETEDVAVTISASPVPTISGVPAAASVAASQKVGPVTVNMTAQDGLSSLTITKNGAAFDTETLSGTADTYEFEYQTTGADANEILTFVFTVEDSDGDEVSFTHTLTVGPIPSEVISGVLNGSHHWTADKIYELANRVIVADGAVLTIDPGTIVKGREGQALNACALMVARGGKIYAEGTEDEPIIFTSILDNIEPGQTEGTNLDHEDRGLWGGLVILGKAPISVSGATEAQIEGVPASETKGLFGGDIANDNSGIIKFVSIRHGGTVIAEGSEINGLTLGGVGSGTEISNVEIFANVDDGIEFFGGSVSVSNLLISYQGDDGIDIDQAYSGTVDGFLVLHGGDTDEGLEIDGPEGTANATGKFTLINGWLIGDPTQANDVSSIADLKARAQGTIENVKVTGYTAGKKIKFAKSFSAGCADGSVNAYGAFGEA